jgi:hypothetical protein
MQVSDGILHVGHDAFALDAMCWRRHTVWKQCMPHPASAESVCVAGVLTGSSACWQIAQFSDVMHSFVESVFFVIRVLWSATRSLVDPRGNMVVSYHCN